MDKGHIKLYRRIQEDPLWKQKPYDRARAWVDMIMLADYTDGIVEHSQRFLAARWGWSRNMVRDFVKYLKKDGKITTHFTTHQTTQIKLCNYSRFHTSTTHQTTHFTTQNKELKEIKEKILLQDQTFFEITPEIVSQFQKSYPTLKVEELLREMTAWCYANPTKRKTRRGVMRFINSWLSRAADAQRQRQEPKKDLGGRHYAFMRCPHCSYEANTVKKGKECPMCEKIVA